MRLFALSLVTTMSFSVALFFFNDTATTEIYTLSLHDALPIWLPFPCYDLLDGCMHSIGGDLPIEEMGNDRSTVRSEEHTSELQSHLNLVCRLLLEKKKTKSDHQHPKHHVNDKDDMLP